MARITQADLESLRMPRDAMGNLGLQDIEALKAATWGSDYDVEARRAKIAEALLAQQIAQAAPVAPAASSQSGLTAQPFVGGGMDGGQGIGAGDAASAGTMSSNQGSQSFSDMIGGQPNDFMSGAPPGNSMFGTGDRSSFEPAGGAMTTSNASMVSSPDTVVGGPFGGRGGEGREGFGEGIADPALGSPTGSPSAPAAVGVPGYGRSGDDTSQQSQDKQSADRAALAEAALAAAQATPTAPSSQFGSSTFAQPGATLVSTTSFTNPNAPTAPMSSGLPSMVGMPSFGPILGGVVDFGKNAFGRGWDAVTAPVMTPSDTPVGVPVATGPLPAGRAPTSFAPTAPSTPGIPSPGGATPGGDFGGAIGGYSETSPGGYTSGPGNTAGFGAGYSGSSDFGNTQGAQGFTAGAPGGGFSVGAASFAAGFEAGAQAAAGTGGDAAGSGEGGGAGQGGDGQGGSDNTGGSSGVG